jgi:protease-4
MSEEDRKQNREMLDAIWNEYRSAVGAARHLSAENLDALADRYMGILPAEEQLAAGLVDTLLYAQDMDSLLRVFCGTKDYHLMTTNRLAQVKRIDSKAADKVAVIYLEGEITDDSGEGIVAKEVIKTLKKINKDDDVKALVVRVNSPGGSAEASEQIWHALENIKAAGKPVVVSMGGMAASGGYYISCGADYIYAEPTTFTGSIGIFGMIPNVAKLRDKVGIDVDGVSTHKYSAASTNMVYKGFTADERAMMQSMVERGYDLFTKRCADGRNKTQDYIKSIGEGRVWIGTKAKELGLVDEFGNIDNAIAKAVELAGLESYKLAYYPEVLDFMEEILKNMDNTTEEERLVMKIRNFASKPRIMALMPELEIQ